MQRKRSELWEGSASTQGTSRKSIWIVTEDSIAFAVPEDDEYSQNKIRIKTLNDTPLDASKMKYSKTQDIMSKMAEESKETQGPTIKTYYNMNNGPGSIMGSVKPQGTSTKGQPVSYYQKGGFDQEEKYFKYK